MIDEVRGTEGGQRMLLPAKKSKNFSDVRSVKTNAIKFGQQHLSHFTKTGTGKVSRNWGVKFVCYAGPF